MDISIETDTKIQHQSEYSMNISATVTPNLNPAALCCAEVLEVRRSQISGGIFL